MSDEEIYKEVAKAALVESRSVLLNDNLIVWSGGKGFPYHIRKSSCTSAFVSHDDLAEGVRIARKRLQSERDAKDAPGLREERDKFKAALEKIRDGKILFCEVYDHIREVLKESP